MARKNAAPLFIIYGDTRPLSFLNPIPIGSAKNMCDTWLLPACPTGEGPRGSDHASQHHLAENPNSIIGQ